ncbi:MAG TPA: acyloxyacyl hydrolase [Anaerovoracaceae bacterium]|nr:acyloxyacyl hydrolase [Anaerovoracaceae bacterium]
MTHQLKLLVFMSFFAATPAHAADGIALIGGTGEDANMAGIAIQWDWEKRWFTEGDWSLGGYWELNGSYWKGDGPSPERNIYGIGITPVFRLERTPINSFAPYIEGGIGINYFSQKEVHGDKELGTNFEFGDHVGIGLRFGEDLQYDFGYRFQHYSNAGMSNSNSGIDFHQLRLRYSF